MVDPEEWDLDLVDDVVAALCKFLDILPKYRQIYLLPANLDMNAMHCVAIMV